MDRESLGVWSSGIRKNEANGFDTDNEASVRQWSAMAAGSAQKVRSARESENAKRRARVTDDVDAIDVITESARSASSRNGFRALLG